MQKSSKISSSKFLFLSKGKEKAAAGWLPLRPYFEFRFLSSLCLTICLYFIACNIGSGWIYLLSASLMAALLLGVSIPFAELLRISVSQHCPQTAVAGQQVLLQLKLKLKRLPFLSHALEWLRVSYNFGSLVQEKEPPFVSLVELMDVNETISFRTPPLRRGIHKLGEVDISTCFPFGLAWWHRSFQTTSETLTVYAKSLPVDGFFLYKLPPSSSGSGGHSRSSNAVRQSTNTRGVRDYVRGDSPRIIHWASTARLGKLMVREFEAEGLPQFDVALDLNGPWASREQFELAVTTANSLLALGGRLGLNPELDLIPSEAAGLLDLPSVAPGIDLHNEILARVEPMAILSHKANYKSKYTGSPVVARSERTVVVITAKGGQTHGTDNIYRIEIDSLAGSTRTENETLAHPTSLSSKVTKEEDLRHL